MFCLPFTWEITSYLSWLVTEPGWLDESLPVTENSCIWFITLSCHFSPPLNLSQDHNKCHFKGSELDFNCEEGINSKTGSFKQSSICSQCWEWGEHMEKFPWILYKEESIGLIVRLTLSYPTRPSVRSSAAAGMLLVLRCVLGPTRAQMLLVANSCLVGGNWGFWVRKEKV